MSDIIYTEKWNTWLPIFGPRLVHLTLNLLQFYVHIVFLLEFYNPFGKVRCILALFGQTPVLPAPDLEEQLLLPAGPVATNLPMLGSGDIGISGRGHDGGIDDTIGNMIWLLFH